MKKLAIGLVVFCSLVMASGAAWSENRAPIPPNGTILDTNTGLVWLQNANCFGLKTFVEANVAAMSLKSGSCGLTDGSTVGPNGAGKWRLPTKDELIARQKNLQGFNSVQAFYWSGSDYPGMVYYVWAVSMDGNKVDKIHKENNSWVWPVRSP